MGNLCRYVERDIPMVNVVNLWSVYEALHWYPQMSFLELLFFMSLKILLSVFFKGPKDPKLTLIQAVTLHRKGHKTSSKQLMAQFNGVLMPYEASLS